jgi:predicted HicB family RNase H-like nuclease
MSNAITNILEYKGFKGSIEVDTTEDILFGHASNPSRPNDLISYEGETIKELREDFQNAIDDYLASFKDESVKDN